jgi:hypothetical protein
MTATTPLSSTTLYDQDFYLWLTTTAEQLKQGKLTDVDWENLIEEIESMGKSQKNALKSLLTVLIEHLLKLIYWEAERERNANHWSREITTFRQQILDLLVDSPSLKPYIQEIFPESYDFARRRLARAMGVKIGFFPEIPPFTREQSLNDDWFPMELPSEGV